MKSWTRPVFFLIVFIFIGDLIFYSPPEVSSALDLNYHDVQNPDRNFDREIGRSFEAPAAQIREKPEVTEKASRIYFWDYEGYHWHLKLLLDDELYNVYAQRTRKRDYDLFASDPYDDRFIENIADTLFTLSEDYGLEESKVPGLCISFVQSLNYSSDLTSAGYDQYPRFPYETLYESGGDCEDTSILSAAILQEMGYDVVLLELPSHMALGISCGPGIKGRSFEYNGKTYYYLETTGRDWQIGEMPEEYLAQPVRIIPICKRPYLSLNFKAVCKYSNAGGKVDINVTLKNVGSERAENATLGIVLQAPDGIADWDQVKSPPFRLDPEEIYCFNASELEIPGGATFRVAVQASGENVPYEEIVSDWVEI